MNSNNPLHIRPARRTIFVLLVAIVLLVAVAGTVWAARQASFPSRVLNLLAPDATATPTRTPRPETPAPAYTSPSLSIVLPAGTNVPSATPVATALATPDVPLGATPNAAPVLPGWLADVVVRYGMDATRRFVVIDLAAQQMVVWDPGRELKVMPVSTGDEARGYRTLAWYGLIGEYWGTFNAGGVYADEGWYLFEDAGHILIHGSPYSLVNGEKVYEEMDALGTYPASKGCIRLSPGDAHWFTSWNPKGVPLVILPAEQGIGAG